MMVLKYLCVFLFLICTDLANSNVPNDSVDGNWAGLDVTLHCPQGLTTEPGCLDCFTTGSCIWNGAIMYYQCPPEAPFCSDKGTCTSQRDLNNTLCNEQILEQKLSCSSKGFFPDLLDCHRYYECPNPLFIPYLQLTRYICPEGYVYDSMHFNCKKQRLDKDCVTMMCTRANTYITYPGNENLYGFCKGPGIPQLFKCPAGQIFNLLRSTCEIIGIENVD